MLRTVFSFIIILWPFVLHAQIYVPFSEPIEATSDENLSDSWRGKSFSVGEWSFVSTLDKHCVGARCSVIYDNHITAGGLTIVGVHSFAPTEPFSVMAIKVQTINSRVNGITREIRDKLAQSLYEALLNDKRSFKRTDGLYLIHFNYGDFAGRSVQVRTEIRCGDEHYCTIANDLAFVENANGNNQKD